MAAEEAKRESRQVNGIAFTGLAVASNVARLRNARGLTTVQLAKLLEEAGRPITASSITKLELGQRKVDVDDLVAIAIALRVSPTALLLPPTAEPTATITVTTGGTHSADAAWDWLLGIAPLDLPEDDDGEAFMDFQTHSRPRGRRNYRGARFDMAPGSGKSAGLIGLGREIAESEDYRMRGASPTDGSGRAAE